MGVGVENFQEFGFGFACSSRKANVEDLVNCWEVSVPTLVILPFVVLIVIKPLQPTLQ